MMGYVGNDPHLSEREIDPEGICFTLMAMTHGYGQGYIYVQEDDEGDSGESSRNQGNEDVQGSVQHGTL